MAGEYKIKGLANKNSSDYRIKGLATTNPEDIDSLFPEKESTLGQDILNLPKNVLDAVISKGMQIPGETMEAGEQFIEHPITAPPRAARGVLSGLLEGGKQLYNLPLNLNTYLASKNVPIFKQTAPIAEKLKIGETGLEHAVMGEPQKGDPFWHYVGGLLPLSAAPESVTQKLPTVTSKGLINKISKEKSKQLDIANKAYRELFDTASSQGLKSALPLKSVTKNTQEIIKNSIPKYHSSLKKYLEEPSIEKAHWAQSELGALQRHLDKISQKTGLTPSQVKTYKAVKEARSGIKKSMFSQNAFGKNPALAEKYEELSNNYKENVIPYTSLEDLSAFEAGKLRPQTAVKNLLNDEEFMINLSKKYPGIHLHSPKANAAKWGALGTLGTLMGYDEIRKLLR